MTRRAQLICLMLLAIGWVGSSAAKAGGSLLWYDGFVIDDALPSAPGKQPLELRMPKRLPQEFTAYVVQDPARQIPVDGSLAGCQGVRDPKDGTVDLGRFSGGKVKDRLGASARAARREGAGYVVTVVDHSSRSCRMDLILPAQLLDGSGGAGG